MKIETGMVVSMHYTLTDDAGATIDSSVGQSPFAYLHGHGNIVPGLEQALEGKDQGFTGSVVVEPAEGYGERNPQAMFSVPRDQFPPDEEIRVGMQVHGEGPQGVVSFTVADLTDEGVVLDANHPLAGVRLHFAVEVLEVRPATEQEVAHGHVHEHGHDH